MRKRTVNYRLPEMGVSELKMEILNKAHISKLNHMEFGRLAQLIHERTNKRISVTTLKRVYGFAARKFNTSKYTLSVLGEYVTAKTWQQAS